MQLIRVMVAMCALGLSVSLYAEARPSDLYKSIIDRNPFGLKDPPPPPPPMATNAPKPEVKKEEFYLTGISTIGNAKHPKAYLLAKDANKKEYDQKFYNLTVGDRQGDLTLLEVDTKGRRVKVAYLGEEKWLSMKENAVPAGPVPAPGMPGVPGGVPGAVPVPLPAPGAPPVQNHQQLTYPNANNNRRTPRSASTSFSPGGYSASGINQLAAAHSSGGSIIPTNPAAQGAGNQVIQGPQTDDDVARQIINLNANAMQGGPPIPPILP